MQTISCKSSAHSTLVYWLWRSQPMISIIRIPFTGSVKLRSLLLKSGPGEQTPAKVALVRHFYSTKIMGISKRYLFANAPIQFANIDNLDFSDAQDKEPLQQFDVAVGREVGEYTLK